MQALLSLADFPLSCASSLGMRVQRLLSNTGKFCAPETTPRVVVTGRVTETGYVVSVRDYGIGAGQSSVMSALVAGSGFRITLPKGQHHAARAA